MPTEGHLLQEASQRWRMSRRYALATVVALFPLIFILDEAVAFGFSPVLPGMLVLALLLVVLPFPIMEWSQHRERRGGHAGAAVRLHRQQATSRFVAGAAWAWFGLWFVLGV